MTAYKAVSYNVDAIQYTGTNATEIHDFTGGDTATDSPAPVGTWYIKDGATSGYSTMDDDTFRNRFIETDTGCTSFAMSTKTDSATVTVEGYKEGATAIQALVHTSTPEVLLQFLNELALSGDTSVIELATQLGALAEDRTNNSRR